MGACLACRRRVAVLRTLFQGVVAAILGFVAVVTVVLIYQSLTSTGPPSWLGGDGDGSAVEVGPLPVADLYLPELPALENPPASGEAAEDHGGFTLPDRGGRYLAILVDLLEADRERDPDRVREILEKLQRLDAPDVRIYRWLGAIYHREGAYREAAVAFARAVDLAPDSAADRFNLASVYLVQQRFPQAIRELNHVIRLQPPFLDDAYAYLGYCLRAMGDEDQARKAWEVSLQLDPDNSVARRYLGPP
jgi:tetratricopeptide (TPR) repeat protein